MAELSNVEQILVNKNGWKDNGDGTLTAPTGKRYDHEAGSTFAERHGLSSDYTPAEPVAPEPVNPNLQEVPNMHVEFQRDADGNIQKDANGKNIVTSFGVKYADGTISYTGAGREGVLEAARQRSRAIEYNKYIEDDRTREDFESDADYNHHQIVKNSRLGQGAYKYVTDKSGETTLYAPGNVVISKGDLNTIRKQYGSEANKLNLALSAAQRTPRVTPYGLRFMVENNPEINSEEEAYQRIYNGYVNNRKQLSNIVNGWTQKAQEQGLMQDGNAPWSLPFLTDDVMSDPLDFDSFKTNFTFRDDPQFGTYEDWLSSNVPNFTATKEEEQTEDMLGDQQGTVDQTIQAPDVNVPAAPVYTGGSQPVGNATTDTTGGYYQPFVQTPTATATTTPGYQTVDGVYPTTGSATTGTVQTPLTQTSGLSAIPDTTTTYDNYTGTTMSNLTSVSQGGMGQMVQYRNKYTGQIMMVQLDADGNPMTYVPAAFERVTGVAKGGMMRKGYAEGGAEVTQNEALYTIAKMNGYNGPKSGTALKAFFNSSDALKAKARAIGVAMAKGGAVLYANDGVDVQPGVSQQDPTFATQLAGQTKDLIGETMSPMQAGVAYLQPEEADFIGTTAGQAYYQAPTQEAAKVEDVTQAGLPQVAPTSTMTAATVTPQVQATTEGLTAVQGTLGTQSQVEAAQQQGTSVSGMEAAQGTATMVNAPDAREIQKGELISGAADATKAARFTEQIQAATATPTKQATVQGQLESLMQQFEGGETPAWAAGSMRTAMATLAARGLGASSMAGQAVIQATMEAALPIAQMDAQTMAQFEAQNLSNRQQRAMLAAQQRATFLGQEFDQEFQARVQRSARIGDIANMNFTAEQQIALENSRAANTMNLNNLSNRQAMVMAEVAALANLDMANLNNRQQAAVQNAQNFLQMDMANLSNEQQTAMFKAQQNIQALFTDQAAENAAAQFNASSENQSNQFFANLSSQVGQFNAAQQNAMNQFNVNSVNAMREFNSELQQQRDLFNAQNGLVIAQANAQWRQNIATMNTAAQNESNMTFAKTMNAFTSTNLDAYWQRERDIMSFAFTSAENAADRMAATLLEKMTADQKTALQDAQGRGTLTAVLLKGALNYMGSKVGVGDIV